MVQQDLTVALTGKDISASDAFRSLARAANTAAKSVADSTGQMNREIESSSAKASKNVIGGMAAALGGAGKATIVGAVAGIAATLSSSVLGVVGEAGTKIVDALKTSVIDYNSTLENAQIGFTSMLGSGKQASKFLSELQDFGLRTPFQTDQLIQLSQQMMGYGVAAKNVIPYLTAIGDATAAAGRTDAMPQAVLAFEQISARGRVDLADVNQLTAAGVPALKIWAGAMGVSTAKVLEFVHTGKWAATDALPMLIEGIEKGTKSTAGLGGMMEKQSQTFMGALSNITDGLNRSLGTAFLPVFKILERGAVAIQKFVTGSGFQQWAVDTGRVVGDAMTKIGAAFNTVFNDTGVQTALADLGASFGDVVAKFGPALEQILPNLVQFGKDALPAVVGALQAVIDRIPTVLAWWVQLSSALAAIGPTIAGVIGFLSDLAGTIFNISVWIKDSSINIASGIRSAAENVRNIINGLIGWLVDAGAQIPSAIARGIFGNIAPINNAINSITSGIKSAISAAVGAARTAASALSPAQAAGNDLNSAKGALSSGMAQARAATVAKAATILPAIGAAVGAIPSIGGGGGGGGGGGSAAKAKKTFASIVNVFRNFGMDIGKNLSRGLLGSVSQIQAAADKMRTAVENSYTNGYISKKTENKALSAITAFTNKLKKLSTERAKVLDQLSSLRADKSKLAASLKSSTIGAGDVTKFGGTVGDGVINLQSILGKTREFTADLKSLVKKGVKGTLLSQLVEGWNSDPDAALKTAQGLLANPTDLSQIIGLNNQLASAAGALGSYAAGTTYDSQINAKAGRAKAIGWEMQAAARAGIKTVSRDLHVHVNVNGNYAGTKDDLAKSIQSVIRDAIRKGTIPKNWATA